MPDDDRVPANSAAPPEELGEARSRAPYVIAGVVALALVALGLTQCGWVQKARLDREVDRLCAIDGGVHVYEVVRLPQENFGPNGEVFPQYRHLPSNSGRFGSAFVDRVTSEVLVAGNPDLLRITISIVRASDAKLLGEVVIYRRSGGDMPGPAAASRYSCPAGPAFDLESQVFKPQEK